MTLYCLLSEHEAPVRFRTLDNALANDALAISELTEGGSVPELKVVNKSDQNVLLMDGEELVGAKQNRVLNSTILIGPKSETVNLNLRRVWNFMSDQGIVWHEIERKYQRMSASPSPTMAMAYLYESQRNSTMEYFPAFHLLASQTGMIVFASAKGKEASPKSKMRIASARRKSQGT